MKQDRMVAIHSLPIWIRLPPTQTWMYNQAVFLPKFVEVHVACERTENPEQFQVSNPHSLRKVLVLGYRLGAGLRKFKKSLAMDVDVHGCREKAMTSPVHADNLSPVAEFHPTVSCRGIIWLLF